MLRTYRRLLCRSFVPSKKKDGVESPTGRFNLGVATVSLAYVALLAKENGTDFYKELDIACEIAFEGNMFRVGRMKGTKANVSPILWQYGALATLQPEDTIDHLFYNGNATCSIGYGGLAEALEILGDCTKEKGLEVLRFMKSKTEEFTERTNITFSVYGSPLENGAYKFAECIKRDFPEYNLGKDFVTNSFHLPVYADLSMEEKFEWESDFFKLSSGGNVNNIELPNLEHNIPALEGVVRMAYDKVNYLICNQPIDACYECGFTGEFKATEEGLRCPDCGNGDPETATATRRVSGYIHDALARPANKGKYGEQKVRAKNM